MLMRRLANGSGYWLLVVAMIGAYLLPWAQGGSASLTFGAYDLAEWASLHPAVRGNSPPFLIPLLLRGVLTCMVLYAALAAPMRGAPRWLVVGVLSAAQLPPFEFFTSSRGDANYQQQAILAGVSLVAGCAALIVGKRRLRQRAAAGAAVLGCVAGIAGVMQALPLFEQFEVAARTGAGAVVLPVLWVVGASRALVALKQTE